MPKPTSRRAWLKASAGLSALPALSSLPALTSLSVPGLVLLAEPGDARAEDAWPSRPIRFVVGYPPGGSTDQMGRVISEAIGRQLKANCVVENLGGASGTIAAQKVIASAPDGYTLLAAANNELVGTRHAQSGQRYDSRRDLLPIGFVAWAPMVIVAGVKTGVTSIAELITVARKDPGRYGYGSSGVGSSLHFAGELLKQRGNFVINHIPYRGVAPLANDLIGGDLDFAVMSPTSAAPFIKDGRIVALGVTGPTRIPSLPDVPAVAETPGLDGYEISSWYALMSPLGLPDPIRAKLQAALKAALKDPVVVQTLEGSAMQLGSGNEDVARILNDEDAKYARVAELARMRE